MFSGVLGAGGAGRGSFVPFQFDRLFGSTKAPNTDYNRRDMEAIFFHRGNPFFQNEAAGSFFSSFLFSHLTTQLVETTNQTVQKIFFLHRTNTNYTITVQSTCHPRLQTPFRHENFTLLSAILHKIRVFLPLEIRHIQHYSVALPLLLTDDDLWLMLLGVIRFSQ